MKTKIGIVLLTAAALTIASAQTPTQVVVQAVPAAGTTAAPANHAAAPPASSDAVLKALQELKTVNEAILKKQAATLEQLDELQKAADQIKVFSKRG